MDLQNVGDCWLFTLRFPRRFRRSFIIHRQRRVVQERIVSRVAYRSVVVVVSLILAFRRHRDRCPDGPPSPRRRGRHWCSVLTITDHRRCRRAFVFTVFLFLYISGSYLYPIFRRFTAIPERIFSVFTSKCCSNSVQSVCTSPLFPQLKSSNLAIPLLFLL